MALHHFFSLFPKSTLLETAQLLEQSSDFQELEIYLNQLNRKNQKSIFQLFTALFLATRNLNPWQLTQWITTETNSVTDHLSTGLFSTHDGLIITTH
ncbi:hypothetical protein ACQZV8_20000, partial [Magnetococcales bacterium HHB-1]